MPKRLLNVPKKTSKPAEFAFNFAKTVLKPAEIKLK